MGLLGKDAQPHGLCPDLLPLPFLPLHASSLQVATQQRKKGADERPFFSLSCHTFYCPELNQIPVSHMDKREREHAEHNPATLSRHLLPASSYPVPGLWQWLLMLWEILWGEKKTNLGRAEKSLMQGLSPTDENVESRASFAGSS